MEYILTPINGQLEEVVTKADHLAALEAAVREKDRSIELFSRTNKCHLHTIKVLGDKIAAMVDAVEHIFREKPDKNGDYYHAVWCNCDRKQLPGTSGVTCCCLPQTKGKIAALTADVKGLQESISEYYAKELDKTSAENARWREALDRFSSFILEECDEWPLAHDAARIARTALKQPEQKSGDLDLVMRILARERRLDIEAEGMEQTKPNHECEYEMGHCVICGEDMSGCKQAEGGGE
jgi:hypothetical protein